MNSISRGCDTVCMMLLSWLSERGAVRNEVLGLGVQLKRWDLFQCVLLLVLHAHAFVH